MTKEQKLVGLHLTIPCCTMIITNSHDTILSISEFSFPTNTDLPTTNSIMKLIQTHPYKTINIFPGKQKWHLDVLLCIPLEH